MHISLLTNIISPHQLPLARELAKIVGEDNYRYVYTESLHGERQRMGWGQDAPVWCRMGSAEDEILRTSEVVYSELRSFELFEERLQKQLLTFYVSERWFKPSMGFFRMMSPSYLQMARRMMELLKHPRFYYLAQGITAARDMLRMLLVLQGKLQYVAYTPRVAFESRPGGVVVPLDEAVSTGMISTEDAKFARRYGYCQIPRKYWGRLQPKGIYSKIRLWGYFVEGSHCAKQPQHTSDKAKRILWVGRMLDWKRVDTLVKACRGVDGLVLSLYGHGSEDEKLHVLAQGYKNICFNDFVPIEQVRRLMCSYDAYVLPSDGTEGWGAVVNEALTEGMKVLATTECGAGASILPSCNLFEVGNVEQLRQKLLEPISEIPIGEWSCKNAADVMLKLCHNINC